MTRKIFENLKSQAAMEYLTTYAWGLLVILAIIVTIYYFGIWDFTSPRQCILVQGLSCYDFKVQSDEVQIVLFNNLGSRITINQIEVDDCPILNPNFPDGQDIEDNKKDTFLLTVCNIAGKKYSSDLIVTYTKMESSLQHVAKGEIRDTVTT